MLGAIQLDGGNYQQCFQNCQREADSHSTGCPKRKDDEDVISLSKLHDASFGLSVLYNLFVVPSMSANQKNLEDIGRR